MVPATIYGIAGAAKPVGQRWQEPKMPVQNLLAADIEVTVPPTDEQAERYISGKIDLLPQWLATPLHRLRNGDRLWPRLLVGVLLIIGGVFWFLPIVGLWMLPLGMIILAEEVPPLRRWLVGVAMRGERWWRRCK